MKKEDWKNPVVWVIIVLMIVALIFVGSGMVNSSNQTKSSSYDFDSEFEKAKQNKTESSDNLVADPDTTYVGDVKSTSSESTDLFKDSTTQTNANTSSAVTREQQNALQKAEDYLDYDAFSKKGLYEQLIYNKYPTDAAQYAIDNVKADWNANALQKATDYLDYSSFSDQELYEQLIYNKYTAEQAQYAIDNLPN